ncbi:SDR family NAD(P)-dependent oxidoreductase [Novosphingobium sp. 17-62-19]|uniref:SDR family NAD(P)-dependent oxidoreductase n=1 Tax=Novosphingobium sp. 17-62-19 TaxID=1970406 RepID=UPI0025D30B9F|nr:SDR family NAD(P)-dependent oxidoreductase [Novosphingobium sp. 17-62-19]
MLHFGTMKPGSRVLVLGASGGLGSAIAHACAGTGASLILWGRDTAKLEALKALCLAAGANTVTTRSLDLRDLDDALVALVAEDDARPVDMAIFASGLGDIRAPGDLFEDPQLVTRLATVNFVAPASLASAMAQRMAVRRRGRITLIGSAAAFHGLPFSAAYCASKAGLARFADSLRIALRPHGVTVTLVSPGFIDTPAARQVPGPKPFMLSPEQAAQAVLKATLRGKPHLIVPWPFALVRLLVAALPRFLRDRLLKSLTPPGI